jgi:hypothetical protein
VLDACTVRECCYVPHDADATVRCLLQWEAATALDPRVSEQAKEFRDVVVDVVMGYAGILTTDERLKALRVAVEAEFEKLDAKKRLHAG